MEVLVTVALAAIIAMVAGMLSVKVVTGGTIDAIQKKTKEEVQKIRDDIEDVIDRSNT
jgi:hypothetical protein